MGQSKKGEFVLVLESSNNHDYMLETRKQKQKQIEMEQPKFMFLEGKPLCLNIKYMNLTINF